MRCPNCGGETEVRKTQSAGIGTVVSRQRQCKNMNCGLRFRTHEMMVQKRQPVADAKTLPPDVRPAQKASSLAKRRRSGYSDFNPFDDDENFIPEC